MEGGSFIATRVKSTLNQGEYILNHPYLVQLKHYDKSTYSHSLRVGSLMQQFGHYLHYEQNIQQELYLLGLVHDIGKLDLPLDIIQKTGTLTALERTLIKSHVYTGYEKATSFITNDNILQSILYHHENMDGTGYLGVYGNELPLYAKMLRIIDSFDAMTQYRCYKTTMTLEEAVAEIINYSGRFYDEGLSSHFVNFIAFQEEKA
jgi:putative nucleotidyltransferase with HDIG domain